MMTMSHTYAQRGVEFLEAALQRQPPPGVTVEFVGQFFRQFGAALTGELAKLLEQLASHRQPAMVPPVSVLPPEGVPPDEWPSAARTAANIAAIQLIASGASIGAAERMTLLRYSGWGGLSIDAVASQLPKDWQPEARGLIHEYYTPTKVAQEIARVLRPHVLGLPQQDGIVLALEPAAGIGRFVHALSGPGFEALSWTAVELSHVAARLLRAVRPDIKVFEGPFERWLVQNEAEARGKLGLIVQEGGQP